MAVTPSSPENLRRWQNVVPRKVATRAPENVLDEFGSTRNGLSSAEAAIRLSLLGTAEFGTRRGWRRIISMLAIFIRPLLLPLWLAAIIAFIIDRDRTGQVLLLAAALNTLVAALQERKAEHATTALYDALPAYARVLRDGQEQHLLAAMLVPGDILLLQPNDIVPADARLIEAENLYTSNPVLRSNDSLVHKTADPLYDEERRGVELTNMVYAGSHVKSGHGRAVVIATGARTAYGHIADLTQRAQEEPSPLLLAFARLGTLVLLFGAIGAVIGYSVATRVYALTTEQGLLIAILFLTAAVPAGLMPGITLTLIEGARRLQQRNAIFRRLSNVETLGATTVICTDKTGTLTQNEMTVREVWTADGPIVVSGVGYQPRGAFSRDDQELDTTTVQVQIGELLRAAVLTSSARLLPPDTFRPYWHIVGDAIEAAHISLATKAGMKADQLYEQMPQLAVLHSDRQLSLDGVIVEEQGQPIAYFKGITRDVVQRCSSIRTATGTRPITDSDRQTIKRTMQRYGHDAMRTIAFASRMVERGDINAPHIDDVAHDLVFLGLTAVFDPPREEVTIAIAMCHQASIRTIMLTGDDTLSATSLARRCGLVQRPDPVVISGPEMDTMDDATLQERLRSDDLVLARLSPDQKVRVVRTLEQLGEVVLVTGNAASDVPALKAAYTGIAMGETGSEAARQAADLVLLDGNFATIAYAVAEGRAVEQRVRRLVALNLAITVVKYAALVVALITGLPLLLTVGQQLLIDVLAGLLPGLALGAGSPDPRLMQRPPRPAGQRLISRKMFLLGFGFWGMLITALAIAAAVTFLIRARQQADVVPYAQLFADNLLGYDERILSEGGRRGLVATTLYVVISCMGLLGAAVVLRATASRRLQGILAGTVLVSVILLIAMIELDVFHPYVALIRIPGWGWAAAFGTLIVVALLELLRQRIDPIYKPVVSPTGRQQLHHTSSPNKS